MLQENIKDLFTDAFQQFWDNEMYSDQDNDAVLNYSEVAQKIAYLHTFFDELDIQQGDKIALLGKNTSNWAISFLATITYGAVIVPILPDFSADDVHHIVNHSDSKLLLSSTPLYKHLSSQQMSDIKGAVCLETFSFFGDKKNNKQHIEDVFQQKYPKGVTKETLPFKDVSNEKLVILNYTSGTTGFSKGVMIPANSLVGNITFGRDHIPLDKGSKMVSFLPLAHTYGCAFDFLMTVLMGVHVTFVSKTPSPQVLLPLFKKRAPQVIITVPLIVEKIYKKRVLPKIGTPTMKVLLAIPGVSNLILGKIKKALMETFGGNLNELIIGGAPLSADAEAFFKRIKFPFTIGYGMTECGPLISYDSWKTTQALSAGKILPNMELRIESKDPYQVPGEICVRGENRMMGYYKNDEATAQVIDKDGWLHTGDMGITDDNGYIYIKGRSKSMLLGPSGQNIYPEEIEARLNNLPFVAESIVLQDKDHKLYALVYADPDAVKESNLSDKEVLSKMEENRKVLNKLGKPYEVVSRIQLHDEEFVKTPKRSIKRFLYENK